MYDSPINRESDISFDENAFENEDELLEIEKNSLLNNPIKSYFNISSNSVLSAVLNICSSSFGAGFLSLPYCLESTGIINTFLVFLFIAGSVYYSLELLRSFLVDTKYSSFSVMTETVLGKKWLIVYAITIFMCYLSVNINYMNINYSIFRTIFSEDDDSEKYFFGVLYLLVTYAIEIFLCVYTRNTNKVHLISLVVVIIFFIFLIIIIIGGIRGISSEKFESNKFFNPFDNKKSYEIFFEFIHTSIMFIYSLAYHSTFPTFLGNVNTLNNKISKRINRISFGIICISYILISFFGYLYQKEVPQVLFLERMEDSKSFITIFLQILIFIMLFSLIPLRYISIRDGYKCLIGEEKFNNKIDLIFTIVCLFIANVIVYVDAEAVREKNNNFNIFSVFSDIFGGFLGVIICFLLPVINYAAINGKTKIKSIIGYIISAFYFIIGIISIYASLSKSKEDGE